MCFTWIQRIGLPIFLSTNEDDTCLLLFVKAKKIKKIKKNKDITEKNRAGNIARLLLY